MVEAAGDRYPAGVAELADAPDSKSGGGNTVWVQVPPPVLADYSSGTGRLLRSLFPPLLCVHVADLVHAVSIPQVSLTRDRGRRDRRCRFPGSVQVGMM
jgi:hypothetical protein